MLTAVNQNLWTTSPADVHLTLVGNGQQSHVTGAVTRTADSLRLYQKDLALQDRDIRV